MIINESLNVSQIYCPKAVYIDNPYNCKYPPHPSSNAQKMDIDSKSAPKTASNSHSQLIQPAPGPAAPAQTAPGPAPAADIQGPKSQHAPLSTPAQPYNPIPPNPYYTNPYYPPQHQHQHQPQNQHPHQPQPQMAPAVMNQPIDLSMPKPAPTQTQPQQQTHPNPNTNPDIDAVGGYHHVTYPHYLSKSNKNHNVHSHESVMHNQPAPKRKMLVMG